MNEPERTETLQRAYVIEEIVRRFRMGSWEDMVLIEEACKELEEWMAELRAQADMKSSGL